MPVGVTSVFSNMGSSQRCCVADDDDDDGRINFNVAYSPKTARTRNS